MPRMKPIARRQEKENETKPKDIMKPRHAQPRHTKPGAIDDDPVPEDINEFRRELAKRISRFIANQKSCWRQCTAPVCRRARACQAPRAFCQALPPGPELSPEESARRMASFRRQLSAIVARNRAAIDKSDQQS